MEVKGLKDEDFVNYKKPSMFIGFPKCSFKCGKDVCQNSELDKAKSATVYAEDLVIRYIESPITSAIVCGGLDPFDTWDDLYDLIQKFRCVTNDDIVIYTGYDKKEVLKSIKILEEFPNIIVKFGRFLPGYKFHYDELLGVYLGSDNQYAERIS
jgi:organic radical activating enzyme